MSEQFPTPSPEKPQDPKISELTKSIFVRRKSGEISAMRTTENPKVDEAGNVIAYLIDADPEGNEYIAATKPVSELALAADFQAALAAERTNTSPEQGESVRLNEVQEDLARTATESTGIHDPSELDERMYTHAEIRAMSEVVRQRTAAQPSPFITSDEVRAVAAQNQAPRVIPDLDKMMGPQVPTIPHLDEMMSGNPVPVEATIEAAPKTPAERVTDAGAALDRLEEALSQSDRIALWHHANAANYAEQASAEKKMTNDLRQNTDLQRQYKAAVQNLDDARRNAGS